MPRIPRFEPKPFGRPEFDPATGKPLEGKAHVANPFGPIVAPDALTNRPPLIQPKPVDAIVDAHGAATGSKPSPAPAPAPATTSEVFPAPKPEATRPISPEAAKLREEYEMSEQLRKDKQAAESLAPAAEAEGKMTEPGRVDKTRSEEMQAFKEGAKKKAGELYEKNKGMIKTVGGLAALGLGLGGVSAFMNRDSGRSGGSGRDGVSGSGDQPATAFQPVKTQAELDAEAAAAKLKADNTPDARLPGGGAAFMRNEGPTSLSGGQYGEFAETPLYDKASNTSSLETGQELLDRLRAESGQTVAVRSKRAADDLVRGNAVADEAAAKNQARILAERDAHTQSALEAKKMNDFVNARVNASSNMGTVRGDNIRNQARADAMREYQGKVAADAAAKVAADKLAMEGKSIDASKEVGLANANATEGKVGRQEREAALAESKAAEVQRHNRNQELQKEITRNVENIGPAIFDELAVSPWFGDGGFEKLGLSTPAAQQGYVADVVAQATESMTNPEYDQFMVPMLKKFGQPNTITGRARAISMLNMEQFNAK